MEGFTFVLHSIDCHCEIMLIGTMLLVSSKLQRFLIAKHFIDFLQIRILKNGKSCLINHQKMPVI